MDKLWAFLISMLPVVELRGGLPFALARGIPYWTALLLAVGGNILPIPLVLLFLERILRFLERFKLTQGLVAWLEKRARAKSDGVQKAQLLGLFIFVAIPLPGTGAWTGALIAVVMGIRMRRSLPALSAGVLGAAAIVTALWFTARGAYTWLVGG